MAYVLGWLVTDGCIEYIPRKRYVIRWDLAERQPLDIILSLMEANHPVRKEERRGSTFYSIMLRSQKAVKDIMELGITPNKTFTLKMPDVPQEFLKDFIRGAFEGDGSVFILDRAKGRKLLNTKFSSASESFIRSLGEAIRDETGMVPKIYSRKDTRKDEGNVYWELRYGGKESMVLYKYMYDNAEYYLERKKAKFEEAQELKAGIGVTTCLRCKKEIVRLSASHKWCQECKKIVVREQWKVNSERKRARKAVV